MNKVISSIFAVLLIFGIIGSQDVFAEPFTLFPIFSNSFSIAAQEMTPQDVAFSSDGTKMFVIGIQSTDVHEYTLSTPFDVSTAAFVDSFSVSEQEIAPTGLTFTPDGTKMFVIGVGGISVHNYSLSTPFDVSTAAFVDSFSVSTQLSSPTEVAFSSGGTKMYVLGADRVVYEYTLSTPFDLSTAVFTDSFSVAIQESSPTGLAISTDGAKMFVIGIDGKDVNEYILSTPFDVTTASFKDTFLVVVQDSTPEGLAFNSDGTKLFIIGSNADKVNEYVLPSAFTLLPTFVDSFSVAPQEISPQGISFSSDGTKMFVLGVDGDEVYEYGLSPPFDVSTASFVDSFSVAAQDAMPIGIAFSSDGTKMFVLGDSGDNVYEYDLSTSFDASTASFVDSFSVAIQDFTPAGFAFSPDGTKMFVVGEDVINSFLFAYTLSVPFDVSTAVLTTPSIVIDSPRGLAFSSDGLKMFVVSSSQDIITGYILPAPFDITTFSNVGFFSVAAQDTIPEDIVFSSDGTKMFVLGDFADSVNEYNLPGVAPCLPPPSGDWTVTAGCILDSSSTAAGDVIIPDGVVLTIPDGLTLDIDFANFGLKINSGGGVLIKSGGAIA